MKTNLLIVIGIVTTIAAVSIFLAFYQEIQLTTGIIMAADCRYDEIKHNDGCKKLEIPQHIGSWSYGVDSIISYCEDMPTTNSGFGLERCIPIEFLDVDELITRIQNNDTEPLSWPSSVMLSWCAERFDKNKHEYQQNFDSYDTPDYKQDEPPLLSSKLHNDEDFIDKGCSKFIDQWAYLTEENDYTWHSIDWHQFNQYHYERKTYPESETKQRCAELFDQIMTSAQQSELRYELTETDEFRELRCASMVGKWEDLTKHNVWNIGISWKDIAANEEPEPMCDPGPVLGDGWCYKNGQRVEFENEN